MAGAFGGALLSRSSALAITPAAPIRWRGVALGAETEIILHHDDGEAALQVLEDCRAEIERLENLFSLYKPQSALVELNRAGSIKQPAFEFVELLSRSEALSIATHGAFDITVQPLWELYSNHFKQRPVLSEGPSIAAIENTRRLVDYRLVAVSPEKIEFRRKGVKITLNGIAQGFITNRIAMLLKRRGFGQVLLNIGEVHGIGVKPSGKAWRGGIVEPGTDKFLTAIPLVDQAMATSTGYGTRFGGHEKYHHLFDPNSGTSALRYKSVSVIANDATIADALSTAFSSMPLDAIKSVVGQFDGCSALILTNTDELIEI